MKLKWKALITACLMACTVTAFVGCNNGSGDGGETEPPDLTAEYGTVAIDDVKVYIDYYKNYTFAELNPVFSKPDKAEELTYTYDTTEIKIDGAVVTPLKRADKKVDVRAKSEHFSAKFQVEIEYILYPEFSNDASDLYNTSRFPVAARTQTCKAVTAETTLFIGDSFMDDGFIGDYMSTYAADKEVLNAGISSTTSYHWEAVCSSVIGETAPKNIVLHIGTNNFYDPPHDLVKDTEESLTRLFMYLHSSYPTSNIYWFNITQRRDTGYADRVSETNAYMATWCAKYDWITCVDTCSKINVSLLKEDGTHPTDEGYAVFTKALEDAGCKITAKA